MVSEQTDTERVRVLSQTQIPGLDQSGSRVSRVRLCCLVKEDYKIFC